MKPAWSRWLPVASKKSRLCWCETFGPHITYARSDILSRAVNLACVSDGEPLELSVLTQDLLCDTWAVGSPPLPC